MYRVFTLNFYLGCNVGQVSVAVKGCELLIEWEDGSTNWVTLKDIKESYPVEVAKFALATHISIEPAFTWWVPFKLKKRIEYWLMSSQSIGLGPTSLVFASPQSVEEAKKIDEQNGDTLWWDAICKEMKNICPAFEVFEGRDNDIPKDYQFGTPSVRR